MTTFVIVGGGLAAAKAAEALRVEGFDGRVVLAGAETHLPYERPLLSKGYLAGDKGRADLLVHDQEWYAEHDVDLMLGRRVTRIDRARAQVEFPDGEPVGYDRLLLATGSVPRRLPVAGADVEGVHTLRTVDESDELRRVLAGARRLAVIGAGWIGLEVTAVARTAGVEVTVVEAAELPLLRVLGPEVAQVFADLHRAHGVDLRFGASVRAVRVRGGRAAGVELGDGSVLDADAVIVAVGIAPDIRLAEDAGLVVDNGVRVDAALRTSDPAIFAAGDVANADHPFYGRPLRVEHWANALNQPAVAAAGMLGKDASYDRLPYFYTDQYDLGMEYVGYTAPGDYDRVVFRGNVETREFVAFWLRDGAVQAGMNVNVWDVTDQVKALIQSRAVVDANRLADPDVPLDELI